MTAVWLKFKNVFQTRAPFLTDGFDAGCKHRELEGDKNSERRQDGAEEEGGPFSNFRNELFLHNPSINVGAGRVRDQRSSSEPSIAGFRLPPINDIPPSHHNSLHDHIFHPSADCLLPTIHTDNENGRFERVWFKTPSERLRNFASLLSTVPKATNYPVRNDTRKDFLQEVRRANHTGNYVGLQRFYLRTFDSIPEICALFKVCPSSDNSNLEDPELQMEFLYSVYDSLKDMPPVIHETLQKSILNALFEKTESFYSKDHVKAFFLLLPCPIFEPQSSYNIFAHLLKSIADLDSSDHQLLVHYLKILEIKRLRNVVRNILQFITIRQFPPADKSLPSLSKSRWWIPAATKVLALIYAASNLNTPPLLDYTEFYNSALDHVDLMQDYYNWQNPHHNKQFSYCQYPFILSVVAKRVILTRDSEQQMILRARKSLADKVARHQAPQIDIFFLNIRVRRSHLIRDSLNEIAGKQKDLKKKLKVSFVNEPGLDMGGLTKEWFLLLIRQIFHPDYGMFVYHPHSKCYWFSVAQIENLQEYNLIGVLMGLAVYNSIILDLHFPSICYKKLLSPPIVPMDVSHVGIVRKPTVDDLAQIMPDVSKGLNELLSYEGNVEEDLCLNFLKYGNITGSTNKLPESTVSFEEFGKVETFPLMEDGENTTVTNENREDYVSRYLDWVLNRAVFEQYRAFYLGFHSVCASNALLLLRPEEVETLVCGSPTINISELKKVTTYDGYRPNDLIIKDFWKILDSLPHDLKKKFLLFTTGSNRIPVGGMEEMTFKITKVVNRRGNLPEAHTCFNQLVLPEYESTEELKQKLIISISNAEGFGLE